MRGRLHSYTTADPEAIAHFFLSTQLSAVGEAMTQTLSALSSIKTVSRADRVSKLKHAIFETTTPRFLARLASLTRHKGEA